MDRVKKIYSKDVWIVVFHLKFNFNNDPKEKNYICKPSMHSKVCLSMINS